jgi:hypothetical protein
MNLPGQFVEAYPFDDFPQSGLIELVRDLIEYAYHDMRPELA